MKHLGGHDINYLATTGVLDRFTSIPMNTVADFAGGGLLAAYSILAAHTGNLQNGPPKNGQAQILDVNLTDGANYIANTFPLQAAEMFSNPAGMNFLDGGSPFYSIYKTKDKKKVAVGCLEPKFYQNFIKVLFENGKLSDSENEKYKNNQMDIKIWGQMRKDFTKIFLSEDRDFWAEKYLGVDACTTPVLTSEEAAVFRPKSFQTKPRLMPKPVPFSLAELVDVEMLPGDHSDEVLSGYGYSAEEISLLKSSKIVA